MHRKLNWLRWTVAVILFVVGLALIFNQQIKSALVDSYRPTVTRQAVVKIKRKRPAMILTASRILACKASQQRELKNRLLM